MRRERRHVVGVDQVVRQPRVLGLEPEQRLEDRVGALLVGERRVRRIRLPHGDEGERVEDRGLAVRGAVPPHGVHRQCIAEQPRRRVGPIVVGVVRANRA